MRPHAKEVKTTAPMRTTCPGCGGAPGFSAERRHRQPVIQNYLCASDEQARGMSKGILELHECGECGLVYNAAFDIELVEYDKSYDGRQEYSGAFRDHLESVVGGLVERYLNASGRVLDVGCGKGGFLRLLRDAGCARCVGYDTSCPDVLTADEGIEYHRSYVEAADIQEEFDLIVCRHVICQVPEPGEFLREMARIAVAAGEAVVAIETPNFEWIAENRCFWDVFYERCNYLTQSALAALCERAGFEVLRQEPVFGSQYQLIELRPSGGEWAPSRSGGLLERYSDGARQRERGLADTIQKMRSGENWAIWGAGGKGVTLCNVLGDEMLLGAIDSNPAKQGGHIPGAATKVIAPDDSRIGTLGLVLIANPNYEDEIRRTLSEQGFDGGILVV